jgi:phenylacetic acid degradation operon negative regulatory protein
MTSARYGELREGVWVRPDNLDLIRPDDGGACTWLSSRPAEDPGELVAAMWDLDGWAATATALRRDMAATVERLEADDVDALADGFVVSAGVLRHLQADPLVPDELLPRRWPGDGLRSDFDRYDDAFRRVWRTWYRALRPSVA